MKNNSTIYQSDNSGYWHIDGGCYGISIEKNIEYVIKF